MHNRRSMKTIFTCVALAMCTAVHAQAAKPAAPSGFQFNPDIDIVLIVFAAFLLLPLYILAKAFVAIASKQLAEAARKGKVMLWLPLLILLSSAANAQQTAPVTKLAPSFGAGNALTISLLTLIAIEFMLILFFASRLLDMHKPVTVKAKSGMASGNLFKWIAAKWQAANFVPEEKEASLELDHDYDGIRELDNVIPPWFTAAFLFTIVIAGIYLYRYHVAKSAPMQIEELAIANQKAELAHEAYLSTQQNSIDENNVVELTGAELEAGKQTFTTLCAVCHKTDGGGMVGPNLTDDYWIHGGGLKDIFKTIKYGVPDKGMISWKDQLSPLQIAQVASYIRTLKGTNPPDAKEKQGVLFSEAIMAADTASQQTSADSITAIQ